MGYAVYEDHGAREHGVHRWAGYSVPGICDSPLCSERIWRGVDSKCEEHFACSIDQRTGEEIETQETGCGLFFCGEHQFHGDHMESIPKPDLPEWVDHLLTDDSWEQWRDMNHDEVARLRGLSNSK